MWVGPWDQESETIAARQVEVNLHGVVRGMKMVLPLMVARGRGHVVTIASAASLLAPPGEALYAATKHAVYGYSSAVAEEIRGSGVDITVVMPTVVDTELAAGTSHGLTPRLSATQVASAVVSALHRPRFEVFVPRTLGAYFRVAALLPAPLRDRFLRATVPDQTRLTQRQERRGYEARTFGEPSEPAAD
jgi:short-subunit dehydrogenase